MRPKEEQNYFLGNFYSMNAKAPLGTFSNDDGDGEDNAF